MIRVAIVDDQPMMREGILCWLRESDGVEVVSVGESVERSGGSGAEPDVVVLSTDDLVTIDVEAARRRWPGAAILTYTTAAPPGIEEEALARGIADCVRRESEGQELLTAVARAASRSPDPLADPVRPRRRGDDWTLTSREREVLRIVAQGRSNRGIAVELDISEHTVKSHIHRAMRKLGAETRAAAVHHAALHSLI